MIYIAGFTFTPRPLQPSEGFARRISPLQPVARKTTTTIDPLFENGVSYKLAAITKKHKEGRVVIQYTFTRISDQVSIIKEFNNTTDGDNFIAALAGEAKQLEQTRSAMNPNT